MPLVLELFDDEVELDVLDEVEVDVLLDEFELTFPDVEVEVLVDTSPEVELLVETLPDVDVLVDTLPDELEDTSPEVELVE